MARKKDAKDLKCEVKASSQHMSEDNPLGTFLRSRRERLDPEAFGFGGGRRRTPGLRREEVAQRAGLSVTWYTWLEQGRGGAPSVDALDALAQALALTDAEREHLFNLALHHTGAATAPSLWRVTERLQKILDALEDCPALIKTPVWDVVAWNQAAASVLTDYGARAPEDRNVMRMLFSDAKLPVLDEQQWRHHARLVMESFRLETQRAGMTEEAEALVRELSAGNDVFASMWADHDVRTHGEGVKRIERAGVGTITLDYASFALDDQPGLGLVIYTPNRPEDRERIRSLLVSSR